MTDCGITCGACPLAGLCGDPVPPAARFVADRWGVVACGSTDVRTAPVGLFEAYEREYTRPLSEAVARRAAEWGEAWTEVLALAESVGVIVDPDAPDVDPAEPKPEGAGCCGGSCLVR